MDKKGSYDGLYVMLVRLTAVRENRYSLFTTFSNFKWSHIRFQRLGPMSVEHKSRFVTQRQRIVRDPKAMRKPQELREEDIARQENETTKNVMQIADILEECTDKVNLFELVINPESFGQTIENIFYLSFLVRDGKVSITEEDMDDPNRGQHDDDDDVEREPREGANIQPMVELTEPPTAEDYQSGLLKKQMVMELDMATWRVSGHFRGVLHKSGCNALGPKN